MPGRLSTRIGEFKPLGFIIGLAICFVTFWFIFHRLPFGTVPAEPAPQIISARELDGLNARLKSDEQSIADLQRKVKCLESVLQKKQKRGVGVLPNCE